MAELAPLEAYAEPAGVRNMTLSPSGSRVAYRLTRGDRDAIYVVDVNTGKALRGVALKEANVHSLAMYNDERLYISYEVPQLTYGGEDLGFFDVRTLDPDTGNLGRIRWPGKLDSETVPYLYGVPPIGVDPNWGFMLVAGKTRANYQQANVYNVDFKHGLVPHSQAQGTGNTIDWFVRPEDGTWVREDFDPNDDLHTLTVLR